jgi:ribose 5-phosphate isomerase A
MLRMTDGTLYRTDQDNLIFDCRFGAITDPQRLAAHLSAIPGMLGHGLFVGEVDALYAAEHGSATLIERTGSA